MADGPATRTRAAPTRLALQWLEDEAAVKAHVRRHGVAEKMRENGGMAVVDNYLPDEAARAVAALVAEDAGKEEKEGARKKVFERMDYGEVAHEKDAVAHVFDYAEPDDVSGGEHLSDAVAWLFEDLIPVFSLARYSNGHHIDRHDDKGHVSIEIKGVEVLHSRKYAAIYYLMPSWKSGYGGVLVDEETGVRIVPQFNRLVVFEVPRFHSVTPVKPGAPLRLSVFGWWLVRGKLYELDGCDDDEEEEADGSAE